MIRAAVLATALATLVAGPAAAESLFAHMKRLCIDTGAEPAAVVAAADAAGWTMPSGKKPKKRVERVMTTPQGELVLEAATSKSKGTVNNTCTLAASFSDPKLAEEAQGWAGQPLQAGKGGLRTVGFLEVGDRHLSSDAVGELPSLEAAMSSLRFLGFDEHDGATFISFSRPAKSPN